MLMKTKDAIQDLLPIEKSSSFLDNMCEADLVSLSHACGDLITDGPHQTLG